MAKKKMNRKHMKSPSCKNLKSFSITYRESSEIQVIKPNFGLVKLG